MEHYPQSFEETVNLKSFIPGQLVLQVKAMDWHFQVFKNSGTVATISFSWQGWGNYLVMNLADQRISQQKEPLNGKIVVKKNS